MGDMHLICCKFLPRFCINCWRRHGWKWSVLPSAIELTPLAAGQIVALQEGEFSTSFLTGALIGFKLVCVLGVRCLMTWHRCTSCGPLADIRASHSAILQLAYFAGGLSPSFATGTLSRLGALPCRARGQNGATRS